MKKKVCTYIILVISVLAIIACIIMENNCNKSSNDISMGANAKEMTSVSIVKDICEAKGYILEDEILEVNGKHIEYIGHIVNDPIFNIQISVSQINDSKGWIIINFTRNIKATEYSATPLKEHYDLCIALLNEFRSANIENSLIEKFFLDKENILKQDEIDESTQMYYLIRKEDTFKGGALCYYLWAIPNKTTDGFSEQYGIEEVFEINSSIF